MINQNQQNVTQWAIQNNCLSDVNYGLHTIYRIALKVKNKIWSGKDLTQKFLDTAVVKNNKMITVAGSAKLLTWEVHLHPCLYDKHDPVYKDRFDTFFHELAHFTAFYYFRDNGHGDHWKACMLAFGYEPSVCYNPHKFNYRGYKDRQVDRLLDGVEIIL